jgi:serine/threonine-protein kinase
VTHPRPGRAVGPWLVEEQIGAGGQATVHRARNRVSGQVAALKVVRPGAWAEPGFRERFRREREALLALEGPHIVPILDAGEAGGTAYLAMPLAREGTLADRIRGGPVPLEEVVRIVEGVAAALDAAHLRGRLHRDVKPGNVLLDRGGVVWLSDFGIARSAVTSTTGIEGRLIGTPGFVAPEAIAGRRPSPAADRYALAAMAFEALTGRPPFRAANVAALLHAHLHRRPPRASELVPGLPREVDAVLARGLAKDPDDRHRTAGAFAAALARAAAPGDPRLAPTLLFPAVRSRRLAPAAAAAAGLLAVAGAATALTLGLGGGGSAGGPPPAPVALTPPPTVPGPDGRPVPATTVDASAVPGLAPGRHAVGARVGEALVTALDGRPEPVIAAVAAALEGDGYLVAPVAGPDGRSLRLVARRPFDMSGRSAQWALLIEDGPDGPRALVVSGGGGAPAGYARDLAEARPAGVLPI